MNLLDYIKGIRKGEGAHRLEKESMQDPFLYEALEGFDSVEDDHMARIEEIQRHLNRGKVKKSSKKGILLVWKVTIAAAVLFVALVSRELFMNVNSSGLQAHVIVALPMDIYVPDNFYKENIAIIAYKNTILTKDLNISVSEFEKSKESESKNSELPENMNTIEIYTPTEQ